MAQPFLQEALRSVIDTKLRKRQLDQQQEQAEMQAANQLMGQGMDAFQTIVRTNQDQRGLDYHQQNVLAQLNAEAARSAHGRQADLERQRMAGRQGMDLEKLRGEHDIALEKERAKRPQRPMFQRPVTNRPPPDPIDALRKRMDALRGVQARLSSGKPWEKMSQQEQGEYNEVSRQLSGYTKEYGTLLGYEDVQFRNGKWLGTKGDQLFDILSGERL